MTNHVRHVPAVKMARGQRHGEVFLAVENAPDRDYRNRPGYPMPGTGFTAGLSGRY